MYRSQGNWKKTRILPKRVFPPSAKGIPTSFVIISRPPAPLPRPPHLPHFMTPAHQSQTRRSSSRTSECLTLSRKTKKPWPACAVRRWGDYDPIDATHIKGVAQRAFRVRSTNNRGVPWFALDWEWAHSGVRILPWALLFHAACRPPCPLPSQGTCHSCSFSCSLTTRGGIVEASFP